MEAVKVKDLKVGAWFTKKPLEYPTEKQVFIRGEYCRSAKKYFIDRFSDINDSMLISGDKVVYTDFIF